MLQDIQGSTVFWSCPCTRESQSDLLQISYREGVLVLPRCSCGTETFLKADYTIGELRKLTSRVVNESGVVWAYCVPLRHVYSIQVHWLLYQMGRTEIPPILELPPVGLLEGLDSMTRLSLWWGFCAMQEAPLALE